MNFGMKRIAILMMLPTGLLGLAACGKSAEKAGPQALVAVKEMNLPAQVIATGTVTPRVGAEVPVGPRVSGTLKKLYVKIGDRVTKGQILGQLEEKDLRANVQRAEASLEAAKAAAVYSKANYKRLQALLPEGYVSEDAVDLARQGTESAVANVKNAQAALDSARIQLSYGTVRAPISGIVESVSTQEGSTVAATFNAPTFVTIIDLSRLEVDAYVDEVDIGGVKGGQKATFTVDAYPNRSFQGQVEAIHPQAVIQNNVVNYDVIIGIKDKFEGILRPTMTANVTITLNTLRGALAIPLRAVHREAGRTYVLVPGEKGPVQRPVTLGRESGDYVQAKAGLSLGDKVYVPVPARAENGNGM
ncbi:MAG: efflux RND transporter periplasmic adaptor subunit [Acidobacteriota bacterium]